MPPDDKKQPNQLWLELKKWSHGTKRLNKITIVDIQAVNIRKTIGGVIGIEYAENLDGVYSCLGALEPGDTLTITNPSD